AGRFGRDAASGLLGVAAAGQRLASWAWVFALIGLAGKLFSGGSPAVRYTADGSYWIYILHLPLVMAVGIVLAPTGLPILVKLLITWTVSMVILVLSYDLMVRSTWVGAWLNGRRRPRAIFRAAAPAEAGRGAQGPVDDPPHRSPTRPDQSLPGTADADRRRGPMISTLHRIRSSTTPWPEVRP